LTGPSDPGNSVFTDRAGASREVGVNFLIDGYSQTQGGVSFDGSLPLGNPDLETNAAVLGYVRSLEL
jgi:hypothetical protein